MEQSIIINRKKSVSIKTALLLFFTIALFGFYLYLYYAEPAWLTSRIPFFLVVLAYLIMPILVFAFIYYFMSIFNHKPVLIVNKKGIHEQMRYRSLGMINWSDIENISVQPYLDKTYLIHIYLINPGAYIKKEPIFKFKRLKYGHVVISTLYFKKDYQKVIDIINYHFELNQFLSHE